MIRAKSKGRQKIKMEKIEKESNLHVAFSKRRSSVFKNANDLCTMTGAEVALLVFSPGNKPYSFGNPSFIPLINRYKNEASEPQGSSPLQPQRIIQMEKTSNEIARLQKRVEDVKLMEESQGNCHNLMEAPLESFTFDELERLKAALEDLRKGVRVQIADFKNQNVPQNGPFFHQPNQLDGIGQSVSADGFQIPPAISNPSNGVGQIGLSTSLDGFRFPSAISNTSNGVGQIGQSISMDGFQSGLSVNNTSNGVGQIGQAISLDDFHFDAAVNNTSNGVGQIGQPISLDDFQLAPPVNTTSNGVGQIGQPISSDGYQFASAVNDMSNAIGRSLSMDDIQFAPAMNNTSNGIRQSTSMDDFQLALTANNMSNDVGQSMSMVGFQFPPAASNTSNGGGGLNIPGAVGFGGFGQLPDNAYNLGSGPRF